MPWTGDYCGVMHCAQRRSFSGHDVMLKFACAVLVNAIHLAVMLKQLGELGLMSQARALDSGRMAAFALRLAGAARFLGPGGALGLLAVLERLLR